MSYFQGKKKKKELEYIGGNVPVLSNTCITFQTEEKKIFPILLVRACIPVGLQGYRLFQPWY